MKKEDILQLGELARLTLTDAEVDTFSTEIEAILGYVSAVDALVTAMPTEKTVGAVHNVFREDGVTNEPGQYTAALMAEMPDTKGEFMRVKKILNPNA